jgi:hypothetical protein
METNTTNKTTRRVYAVLDKDFTYESYIKGTIQIGDRLDLDSFYYDLTVEGVRFCHGVDIIIPNSYFHIEEVITTEEVKTTIVTRVVQSQP